MIVLLAPFHIRPNLSGECFVPRKVWNHNGWNVGECYRPLAIRCHFSSFSLANLPQHAVGATETSPPTEEGYVVGVCAVYGQ